MNARAAIKQSGAVGASNKACSHYFIVNEAAMARVRMNYDLASCGVERAEQQRSRGAERNRKRE